MSWMAKQQYVYTSNAYFYVCRHSGIAYEGITVNIIRMANIVFTSQQNGFEYKPHCFNGQCNLHDQSTSVIEWQWFEYRITQTIITYKRHIHVLAKYTHSKRNLLASNQVAKFWYTKPLQTIRRCKFSELLLSTDFHLTTPVQIYMSSYLKDVYTVLQVMQKHV